jgi:putative tryptophan/tyrosine transport system substrate-binding protein
MAPELSQKRLELLKEAVPNLQRVTVLSNPGNPAVTLALQETQTAAQALRLAIQSVDVRERVRLAWHCPPLLESRRAPLFS